MGCRFSRRTKLSSQTNFSPPITYNDHHSFHSQKSHRFLQTRNYASTHKPLENALCTNRAVAGCVLRRPAIVQTNGDMRWWTNANLTTIADVCASIAISSSRNRAPCCSRSCAMCARSGTHSTCSSVYTAEVAVLEAATVLLLMRVARMLNDCGCVLLCCEQCARQLHQPNPCAVCERMVQKESAGGFVCAARGTRDCGGIDAGVY